MSLVTHRRRAQQDLLEMIWYVGLIQARNPGIQQEGMRMRRRDWGWQNMFMGCMLMRWALIVSLASYHHGTCTYDLINLPRPRPRTTTKSADLNTPYWARIPN